MRDEMTDNRMHGDRPFYSVYAAVYLKLFCIPEMRAAIGDCADSVEELGISDNNNDVYNIFLIYRYRTILCIELYLTRLH